MKLAPELTPTLAARIESRLRVADNGSCLEWTGPLTRSGYANIGVGQTTYRVHRVVAQAPADRVVDHICGNRACQNPQHLRLVTQSDNLRHRTIRQSNKHGFPGVRWAPRQRKYASVAKQHGKQHHIGYFTSPEEAYAAWREWQQKHNPFVDPAMLELLRENISDSA